MDFLLSTVDFPAVKKALFENKWLSFLTYLVSTVYYYNVENFLHNCTTRRNYLYEIIMLSICQTIWELCKKCHYIYQIDLKFEMGGFIVDQPKRVDCETVCVWKYEYLNSTCFEIKMMKSHNSWHQNIRMRTGLELFRLAETVYAKI